MEACRAYSVLETGRAYTVLETGRANTVQIEVVQKSCRAYAVSFYVVQEACGTYTVHHRGGKCAMNPVRHLGPDCNLGESKSDGVAELVEVLIVPLSDGVGHLVVHILPVDN